MQIRLAVEVDLEAIVEIYNAAIPTRLATADLTPVSVESRRDWFRSHSDRYPVWVITDHEQIIGWLSLQMFYGRIAYHKTAEVSIYIAPTHHAKVLAQSYSVMRSPLVQS